MCGDVFFCTIPVLRWRLHLFVIVYLVSMESFVTFHRTLLHCIVEAMTDESRGEVRPDNKAPTAFSGHGAQAEPIG